MRFPGRLPLDRPTVGGATPTLLAGVLIRGVCSSAYLLTSGHVRYGYGVQWGMGRVRRPLLADCPKRDAMLLLNSAHARARQRACKECCEQSVVVKAKVGVVVVVTSDVKENPDYQNNSAAHEHLIPIRLGTGP